MFHGRTRTLGKSWKCLCNDQIKYIKQSLKQTDSIKIQSAFLVLLAGARCAGTSGNPKDNGQRAAKSCSPELLLSY